MSGSPRSGLVPLRAQSCRTADVAVAMLGVRAVGHGGHEATRLSDRQRPVQVKPAAGSGQLAGRAAQTKGRDELNVPIVYVTHAMEEAVTVEEH